MPLQQAESIKLRAPTIKALPDEVRTPQRDEVARYILNDILPADRWPMNMTELAEETGYSRQHVSNVILHYFEEVDKGSSKNEDVGATEPTQIAKSEQSKSSQISIPDDVDDKEAYLRGWTAGYRYGKTE